MRCYYEEDGKLIEIVEVLAFDHCNDKITGINSNGEKVTVAEDKLFMEED